MPSFASSVRTARVAGLGVLWALSLVSQISLASPTFPSVVESEIPMQCTPDCTICHTDSPGTSAATATKPFAIQVLNPTCMDGQVFPNCRGTPQGVKAGDTASLVAQLTRIKTDMTDSDGDTLSDAVELGGTSAPTGQLTTDPNTPDSATMPSANVCPIEPAYGCGAAHVTPHPHAHADLILYGLVASAVALGLWRRSVKRRAL